MSQQRPRPILATDRTKIVKQLASEAATGRFNALRNRALYLLAWTGALRLGECLALNVEQVLERPDKIRVRSSAHIGVEQAKGRTVGRNQFTSAGMFVISKAARRALQAYLREARACGAIEFPVTAATPLWVQRSSGRALRARTIQYQWQGLLRRAGAGEPYRFHDMRHDAMMRFADACGGDVFRVAAFGRCDVYTAQRYVHVAPARLAATADRAAAALR